MPVKNAEVTFGELYIKNPDSDDLIKLGPVKELQMTDTIDENTLDNSISIPLCNELTLIATMDFSNWVKMHSVNNYRKLHGHPTRRKRQLIRAQARRYRSVIRRYLGSVKMGRYVLNNWMMENGKNEE